MFLSSVVAMKFAKEYKRYMQGMKEELPTLGLKRLKQMIKKCNAIPYCPQLPGDDTTMVVTGHSQCTGAGGIYFVLVILNLFSIVLQKASCSL